MLVNQLLVRYRDGYAQFYRQDSIDLYGVRESFLSLGALSRDEAERQVEAAFDRISMQTTAYTAAVLPRAADVPLLDYDVGDTVVAPTPEDTDEEVRVLAVTITTDDTGAVQFVPELNEVVQENQDRVEDWLRSMAGGALAGTRPASPTTPRAALAPTYRAMPGVGWDGEGLLSDMADLGRKFTPPRNMRFVLWTVDLDTAASSGTTTVVIKKNGTTVVTINISAGQTRGTATTVVDVRGGNDWVAPQITAAGTGAEGVNIVGWTEV